MKKLRRFDTEDKFSQIDYEYPRVSYVDETSDVYFDEKVENYILATYINEVDDTVDYDQYISNTFYSMDYYMTDQGLDLKHVKRPDMVESEELVSIDETTGEATYKIHLKMKGYDEYDMSNVFGGVFLGSAGLFSSLKHIDFSNVKKDIVNLTLFSTQIEDIYLTDNVKSLGEAIPEIKNYFGENEASLALAYNSLKSIHINKYITKNLYGAIYSMDILTSITIDKSNEVYSDYDSNVIVDKTTNTLLMSPNGYIPNTIKIIGGNAIYETTITSLTIPNSVVEIEDSAISLNRNLKTITFEENSNLKKLGNSCFGYNTGLTSIVLPEGLTEIGERVFYNCRNLTSVTIPDSVETILSNAFDTYSNLYDIKISENSKLKNFTKSYLYNTSVQNDINAFIPSGVTELVASDFCDKITSFTVSDLNEKYYTENNCLIEKDTHKLIFASKNVETIPDSVTEYGDISLNYVNITSFTVSDTVTSIGRDVFNRSLTDISIGANVSYIHKDAFDNNNKLSSFTISENNSTYSDGNGCNVLYDKVNDVLLKGFSSSQIPNTTKIIDSYAFYNCSDLISVTIPNSVTSIGDSAFSICTSLTSVTIPNSVTEIDKHAFHFCTSLTSVIFEEGCKLTTISSNMFQYCSSLTSITIPNSVTSIGSGAFFNCTNLTSITIPDSVTSIDYDAFTSCNSLTSMTIPNGKIESSLPSNIKTLNLGEGVTSVEFRGTYPSLTSITVSEENQYLYTIENNTMLVEKETDRLVYAFITNNVIIPEGIKIIGKGVLYSNTVITSLTIPSSVEKIEFIYSCNNLNTITSYSTKIGGPLTDEVGLEPSFMYISSTGTLRIPQGSDYRQFIKELGSGWTVEYMS